MIHHPIPSAALAHHIAILGKTGSGKTVAAKGMVEGLLDRGERVCVIDPTGVWWGLRLQEHGNSPGFEVAIFGGLHGDLSIGAEHGEAIAEIIGGSSTSAVIDTSQMRVGERTRFFSGFGQAILRCNRGPLHLVIDECHLFMPQGRVNDPASGMMLHAANNMVSLGRSKGLRITLISQRPAKVHKDSLSQVETLVAMRLVAPQDRNAVDAWIADNDDQARGREVIQSLPSLKQGEGWIWAPELDLLKRVRFPMCTTFDSSNPERSLDAPPELAPMDLAQVGAQLMTMVEEAKAADPKALQREIDRLKKELQRHGGASPAEIAAAEERGLLRAWEEARRHMHGFIAATSAAMTETERIFAELKGQIRAVLAANGPSQQAGPAPDRPMAPLRPVSAPPPPGKLGPERKPLAVLARVSPSGMTEAQWAIAAGFKRSGGTWGTYLSRLKTAEMIRREDNRYFATPSGVTAIGGAAPTMPPPGPGLVDFWAARIPGARKLLPVLMDRYPQSIGRDDLAAAAGLTASAGTYGTYLSRLRAAGVIEILDGSIRLAPATMEEP